MWQKRMVLEVGRYFWRANFGSMADNLGIDYSECRALLVVHKGLRMTLFTLSELRDRSAR